MPGKRRPDAVTHRQLLERLDRTEPKSGPAMRMLAVLTADAKRPDPPQ